MNKNNYKLYKSNTILNNREDLINVCYKTHNKIINSLKVSETTWSYAKYNFFQMSSCNVNCYHLFIELFSYSINLIKKPSPRVLGGTAFK